MEHEKRFQKLEKKVNDVWNKAQMFAPRTLTVEEKLKAITIILTRQAVLTNILQRKAGVTDEEIIEEEKRLKAHDNTDKRTFKRSHL